MSREKTGCTIYVESRYSWDEIDFYPRDCGYTFSYDAFRVSLNRRDARILDGNKITAPIPAEEFILCSCAGYVEDPRARAEEILSAQRALTAQYKEFEAACSKFNVGLPSCLDREDSRNFRGYWR